jgi:hypothetical protein
MPQSRFHAMDATRAFALLLGVVFHAAWSFCPVPIGAPVVDASASTPFYWFFLTSHTFRMQLFFLIAGFFAHLLYHRRGAWGFAHNRLLRVGLPLVVGWFLLAPLIIATWTLGANVSGRNLVELPLSALFAILYQEGQLFVAQSSAGFFSLMHLWFLYYLLWLYACIMLLRSLPAPSSSIGLRLRRWADAGVATIFQRPSAILFLVIFSGFCLWGMDGWIGVDTPTASLRPSLWVLLVYGSCFGLGWLLHRQSHLVPRLCPHWRWQVTLALLLSVPLFLALRWVQTSGFTTANQYPRLEANQITDWPAFLARLQSAHEENSSAELAALWRLIPNQVQANILALSAANGPDVQAGVALYLNSLLRQSGLFATELPPEEKEEPVQPLSSLLDQNRAILDRLFAGSLAGGPVEWPGYARVKLLYSLGYALVMWLLIFGTLGFFHERCQRQSPAWRYLADSSYWVYLAHIPLVPLLQIWMGPWAWPGPIKLPFLILIAFVLLFSSYHFLVRSTAIGRILNGQSYPFEFWPSFLKPARQEATPVSTMPKASG